MGRMGGILIGRFLGIPVYIHPTWFIILTLFSFAWGRELISATEAAPAIGYTVALLAAVTAFGTLLAHEFGHAMAARWFGIRTNRITLFLLGGVAEIRAESRRPVEELVIAIAGPAVSLVCMVLFLILAWIASMAGAPALVVYPLQMVGIINLVFAVFNMLPGFPMDGGRVLRAIVWMSTNNHLTATRIAFWGGKTLSYMLIGLGIMVLFGFQNVAGLLYILLGWFLGRLGRAEYQSAQMRSAFDRVHVGDLMRPVQVVVPAELTLRDVVRDFIYRVHLDRFPVVRGHVLLGYITADDIAAVDRSQWDSITAERLARPFGRAEVLSPEQDALQAFQKVSQSGVPQMAVFKGRELVGFLFAQDIVNYMRKFKLV